MLPPLNKTVMKYPIGIQDFESIINGGYVYVDKTALVYRLVTEGKIYFLCRPRRFGKSLLVSTLKAYFQGKKDLFKGLAIDGLETEWAEYPVFHLSFGGENFIMPGNLEKKMEDALNGWEEAYGSHPNYTSPGNRFQYVLTPCAARKPNGKGNATSTTPSTCSCGWSVSIPSIPKSSRAKDGWTALSRPRTTSTSSNSSWTEQPMKLWHRLKRKAMPVLTKRTIASSLRSVQCSLPKRGLSVILK